MRSAQNKAETIELLGKVWWGDSNLGLPDRFDVQTIGNNALRAYLKLCYKATLAKVLQCLVTYEPRFLGVELQHDGPLTKKAIEKAQRRLEASLTTTATNADRSRSNTTGGNGNKSRSPSTSVIGVKRAGGGSMSDRSWSATQGSDSRPGSRLAVFEPNSRGGLGRRFVGAGAVDVKDPLITWDIGGVPGYDTIDGIRHTHTSNNQADVQQWNLPVLKTEPKIKIESANDAASMLNTRPRTPMVSAARSTEQIQDTGTFGGYIEHDYGDNSLTQGSPGSTRDDCIDDGHPSQSRPLKRSRLDETLAQPAQYQPAGATKTASDLIVAENQDLARLRTLLNDIATPQMLKEMIERFKYSVGNEQECAKSAFNHAFLQITTQIVMASKARVKAPEEMK